MSRQISPRQRKALEDFRDMRISLTRLRLTQVGRVSFDFKSKEEYIRALQKHADPAEPGIPVKRQHLIHAYDRWKSGAIDVGELANWAAMLTMNDDYDLDEKEEELIAEWLNTVVADGRVTNPKPS